MTDIRSFYPSISLDVLRDILLGLGAHVANVDRLVEWLESMMSALGETGLPVGPEASGLLANAYLLPLDRELERLGVEYFRVTDDVLFLLGSGAEWSDVKRTVDFMLGELGLSRHIDKSDFIQDRLEAMRFVRDATLSAADRAFAIDDMVGLGAIQDLIEVVHGAAEPSQTHFKYAIRSARRLGDPHAIGFLLDRPELIELDPHAVGDYLRELVLRDRRHLEPFFRLLENPPTARTQAVVLHIIRAAFSRKWGAAEGSSFEGIAGDAKRPAATRAFATRARAACPGWSLDDAIGVVESSALLNTQRAAVLGMQTLGSDRERLQASAHAMLRYPELVPTALYAMSPA